MVLSVKPTSDQMVCLLAQGDRRRRVNLQHAPLHHEPDPQAEADVPALIADSSQPDVFGDFEPKDFDSNTPDHADRG